MSEKLSIAYVFDGEYAPGEGVSRYIETLGNYYKEQGHKVTYFVGNSMYSGQQDVYAAGRTISFKINGNHVRVPLPMPHQAIQETLAEVKPDILHVQVPYSPFGAAKYIKNVSSQTAVIGTFHIVPKSGVANYGSRFLKIINRATQHRFDYMISVSPAARDFAKAAYSIESEVIPCPVDVAWFQKSQRLPEYDDKKTNIVFLGRLVERKGCHYLLEAIGNLDKTTLSQIRVLIAGKGPLLSSLKRQAKALGIDGIVNFLGFVEDKDVPNLFTSADIAVFPATGGESFGIVLTEAMASRAGVVLGGNNKGYSWVLNNQATVFDPKDKEDFSMKLSRLINNPKSRKQLHEIQQKELSRFDVSIIGPKMLEIYRSALEERRKN